jgi:carboxypeptidase C (cathepsin A)
MNDYIRRELEFETDLVYRPLAFEVFPWKWEDHENQFVNVAEVLRQAMTRNPFLHVLFTSGYYDFATPYFDTVYTVNHLGLPEELRGHVSIAFYEAGHMMYIRKQDHAKLKRDVADFIARATPAP